MTRPWARRFCALVAWLAAFSASAGERVNGPDHVRRLRERASEIARGDRQIMTPTAPASASGGLAKLIASTGNGYVLATRVDGDRVYSASSVGIEIYHRAPNHELTRLGAALRGLGALAVDARGSWAAGIDFEFGWFIIDVSDPEHAVEIVEAEVGDPLAQDVAVGSTFIAISDENGVRLFSLLSGQPVEVDALSARGALRADGSRLLCGDGSLWQLADPAQPLPLASAQRTAREFFEEDMDFEAGLAIFGAELWSYLDPGPPSLLTTLPGSPATAALDGLRLYAENCAGSCTLEVWSIVDPGQPELLGSTDGVYDLGFDAADGAVWRASPNSWGLETLDVADPPAMTSLADSRVDEIFLWEISLSGRWLAGLAYDSTVHLLDTTNVVSLLERPLPDLGLSYIDALIVSGDFMVVRGRTASTQSTLAVVDLSTDPPSLLGHLPDYWEFDQDGTWLAARTVTGTSLDLLRLEPGVAPSLATSMPGTIWSPKVSNGRLTAKRTTGSPSGSTRLAVYDLASDPPLLLGDSSAGHGQLDATSHAAAMLSDGICWAGLCSCSSWILDLGDPNRPVSTGGLGGCNLSPVVVGSRGIGAVGSYSWWYPQSDIQATRLDGQANDTLARISAYGASMAVDEARGLLAVASDDQIRFFDIADWLDPAGCQVESKLQSWVTAACADAAVDVATLSARTVATDGCLGDWQRTWALDGVIDSVQHGATYSTASGMAVGTHELTVTATCTRDPECAPVIESTSFVVVAAAPGEVTELKLRKHWEDEWTTVIELSWPAVPEAQTYDVERSSPPYTTWRLAGRVASPVMQSYSSRYEPEERYRVRARNACGQGP